MVHLSIRKFYVKKSSFVYISNLLTNNYNYCTIAKHKRSLFFSVVFFLKKKYFFSYQDKFFFKKNNYVFLKEYLYHQKKFVDTIKSTVYKLIVKKHMGWLYFNKRKNKLHRYSIFLYFLNKKIKLFNFSRKMEIKAFLIHTTS
nr:hypothetical protein CparaKRNrm3_p027 [Cryptomonas paramecium]